MEPPLPLSAPPPSSASHLGYPDSVDSSPRSRNTDSWDEQLPTVPGAKLRLMCSYGGHIVPRPHDKSLCYLGGDTRIVVVDRNVSLSNLSLRLSQSLLDGRSFTLKYQLPNEDLDSLISVTTDEDLENMKDEYDRTSSSFLKPPRLRLFLFPSKPESSSSIGSILNDSKSENWFVEALNCAGNIPRGQSVDSTLVKCLLDLDDVVPVDASTDIEGQNDFLGNKIKQVKQVQDVHSVSDSPMLETSSSFGSASSSPSVSNLPPIRVRVEDQKVGLDEQFSQMSVSAKAAAQNQEERFVVLSSPSPLPTPVTAPAMAPVVTISSTIAHSENPNRVFSDDEKSGQGELSGFWKPSPPQLQQKTSGVTDLPSPEGISRDSSTPNAISRAKPVFYQDPVVVPNAPRDNRVSANSVDQKWDVSEPNYGISIQQVQDSGFVLPQQLDQQHKQHPQFVHAGTHYIQHHPSGPVPISYYPMYQQQEQQHHHPLNQHYPVYFMPARQSQPYNLPMQSNLGDAATITSSRHPTHQNPTMIPTPSAYRETSVPIFQERSVPPTKPELAASVYRTATGAAPPQVHMPSDQFQQQYLGYHQMAHPSQNISTSAAPAATANYAYEFMDPAHSQIYYTQPPATTLPT